MLTSEGGGLIELKPVADDIATALERGECPDPDAIAETRALLRALDEHLDDVCALYGIPRWETNVRWNELDKEEHEVYQEEI